MEMALTVFTHVCRLNDRLSNRFHLNMKKNTLIGSSGLRIEYVRVWDCLVWNSLSTGPYPYTILIVNRDGDNLVCLVYIMPPTTDLLKLVGDLRTNKYEN